MRSAVGSSRSAAGRSLPGHGSRFATGAPLLIAAATAVSGTLAAAHYHRLGLSLAHYDARAHLVVARRIFDSLTPGWQQVGAVWLPLPHLLNAVPVQIDWLYRTGYSAIVLSILSMALASWAIARLIQRATGSVIGGIVAAVLLMINPDVLYLQSTPMTEPLLFATTFLAVALIAEWAAQLPTPNSPTPNPPTPDSPIPNSPIPNSPTLNSPILNSSKAAGWSIIAAVLTRYEAFPIIGAAIVLALVVLLRRGFPLTPALRAVRGLALWPLWAIAAFSVNSKVSVGSFFVSGGFFVAENPALGHPWLAWTQVWEGLVRLTGPIIPWLSVLAVIAILAVVLISPEAGNDRDPGASGFGRKTSLVLVLSLAACAALPLYAYFKGHPVRIRYDVPLVAACAAIIGSGLALLPRRLQPVAGILVVALSAWQTHPFDDKAPVVVESQREAPNMEGRRAVTGYLAAHWDGSPIFMSMGSLGHYMHDLSLAGFNVRDFLHEGNGEIWKYAVAHPAPVAEWIVIEERAEGGDALNWQALHDANFLRGYAKVATGGGVSLYRRSRDQEK